MLEFQREKFVTGHFDTWYVTLSLSLDERHELWHFSNSFMCVTIESSPAGELLIAHFKYRIIHKIGQ